MDSKDSMVVTATAPTTLPTIIPTIESEMEASRSCRKNDPWIIDQAMGDTYQLLNQRR
jgi:hypothetical protein